MNAGHASLKQTTLYVLYQIEKYETLPDFHLDGGLPVHSPKDED